MKQSIIAITEGDEPDCSALVQTRLMLAQAYGGGAALELPLHITLFRWASKGLAKVLLPEVAPGLRARLGVPQVAIGGSAVWCPVHLSKPLLELQAEARIRAVGSGALEWQEAVSPLHVTLAYRDYSVASIGAMYQTLKTLGLVREYLIDVKGLALCASDEMGTWRVVSGTR